MPTLQLPKRKPGQPSKYDPRYCDEAIEYIGRGHSTQTFARTIGVSKTTLLTWTKKHQPFAEAMTMAESKRAELIEDVALRHAIAGNGRITALLLRNWTDLDDTKSYSYSSEDLPSADVFSRLYEEDPVGTLEKLITDMQLWLRIEKGML